MSTKTGSSRIPLFGSRIPQQSQQEEPIVAYKAKPRISDKDIGKLVRVADKEGILRFVGSVLFSPDTWCGIELRSAIGKYDGCVFGVRYFQCPPKHGLMAPLSKVVLLEEDNTSGPYSIICELDATITKSTTCIFSNDDEQKHFMSETTTINDVSSDSERLTIDDNNCTVIYNNDLQRTSLLHRTFIMESEPPSSNLNSPQSSLTITSLQRPFDFLTPLTKLTHSIPDGESTKRDSFDFEESLGILTPDQMMDTTNFACSRTPSSENVNSLPQDSKLNRTSPSQMDSLGIIDEKDLAVSMELPLDSIGKFKDFVMARVEQTPSPEELPLDNTPVVKADETKSGNNTFIVSIASITSLDTGYQGDGEMSRPASRGADNSPMTRRPLPRPQLRRNDPMTDSDFYTESDADNHDEQSTSRGDRHARIIDGTLYSVDPQTAADLYVNNKENMDSSGVFTDIETSTNDLNKTVMPSPSGSSTKTISGDSENNPKSSTPLHKSSTETIIKHFSPTPSSLLSSPLSVRSPVYAPKEEPATKKHKMPKRNVPSKVKTMMGGVTNQQKTSIPKTKSAEKTESIVGKISKKSAEETKSRLKDIKSKVFGSGSNRPVEQKPKDPRTNNAIRQNAMQKSPNNKQRWVRPRIPSTPSKKISGKNESAQSSLSDLSGASPAKNSGGSAKKREVVQVTQVLTPAKLPPKTNSSFSSPIEVRKHRVHASPNDSKNARKKPFTPPKEKKLATSAPEKECGRVSVKGGRTSPNVRPQIRSRASVKQHSASPDLRTVEALGVLIQHLVFNMEAFRVPILKKQVEKVKNEAEESRLMNRRLAEVLDERTKQVAVLESNIAQLLDDRTKQVAVLEEERDRFRDRINELVEEHANQITNFKCQQAELERRLIVEQRTLKEYLEKEASFKEQLDATLEENDLLKDENSKLLSFCNDPDKSVQEVQSLRAVLELKQSEIAELRRMFAEAAEKAEQVPTLEEKLSTLKARCEDLQLQLERKNLYEQQLHSEKKKLEESYREECNQKRRLLQYKEELQWKLQQNKEVVNLVLEQAEENSCFNRSLLSSSFNERHVVQKPHFERTYSFRERTYSNRSNSSLEGSRRSKKSCEYDEEISPPSSPSPKVKGVVEKSDSVSYVLDLDENPAVVASRIVRRSIRNTTPPKNTPTKSPANKRPRTKSDAATRSDSSPDVFMFPFSSTPKTDNYLNNAADLFEEEEDDLIDIPALPSEIGRKDDTKTLSVSLHLAREMESNSEDESTSSSSVQL